MKSAKYRTYKSQSQQLLAFLVILQCFLAKQFAIHPPLIVATNDAQPLRRSFMFLFGRVITRNSSERAPRYDKENAARGRLCSVKRGGYLRRSCQKSTAWFGPLRDCASSRKTRLAMAAPGLRAWSEHAPNCRLVWQAWFVLSNKKGGTNPSRCCRRQVAGVWGFLNHERPRVIRSISEARPKRTSRIVSYGKKSSSMGKHLSVGFIWAKITGESPLSVFAYLTPDKETFIVKTTGDTISMRDAIKYVELSCSRRANLTKSLLGPSSIQYLAFALRVYWRQSHFRSGNVRLKSVDYEETSLPVSNDAPT